MKNVLLFAAFFGLFFVVSCDKDDDSNDPIDYQYQIHIDSPNTDDKHVGDSIDVRVHFESQTDEIVHHINVRIYKLGDETVEIFNKPDMAHIHAHEGNHEFLFEDFELSNANGVTEHTDWVLEAKVWAETEGEAEVIEMVQFHVHPE